MSGHGSYSKTYTEDFNTAISKGKTRSEALTYASEQRDLRVENKKKREEGYGVNYDDRGGLPKKLRYPFSAIENGMDFLKISIATYTPPNLNLEGLASVDKIKSE